MTGVYVMVAVLVLAGAFGLWRQRTDGRMQRVPGAASGPGMGSLRAAGNGGEVARGGVAGGPEAGGPGVDSRAGRSAGVGSPDVGSPDVGPARASGPGGLPGLDASAGPAGLSDADDSAVRHPGGSGVIGDAGPAVAAGPDTGSAGLSGVVGAPSPGLAETPGESGAVAGGEDAAGAAIVLSAQDLGQGLGERATLVQFSSAFCAPCRTTRVVLADVAATVPGVDHVEVDAESRLELVRRLGVTRTPTVLILDADGTVRIRATGAPRKADVLTALAEVV